VFLHIGAPKTGTTYLQHVLFNNVDALASRGVLYPYADLGQSFRSAHDFCGTRWFGLPADRFHGEWDQVAERARTWDGPTVIVSSELLAAAPPDRIGSGIELLMPAEVHLVFSARDLARQLVSDWQEQVKHRHTVTLERFVDDLVTLGLDAPKPFGALFWGMHDAAYVLARWSKFVPPERIHIVTVPQRGGPRDALWTRFCSVTGLDPSLYDTTTSRTNRSMGVAETELVRRMNRGVKKMDSKSYDILVRLFLAEKVLGRSSQLTLPPEHRDWVQARSRVMIDELRSAGYRVEGDLNELLPVVPRTPYVSPTALSDEDLGPAALKAATALLNRAGKLRDQNARLAAAHEDGAGSRGGSARSGLAGAGRRAAKRLLRKH
jgi:hypothetical protein